MPAPWLLFSLTWAGRPALVREKKYSPLSAYRSQTVMIPWPVVFVSRSTSVASPVGADSAARWAASVTSGCWTWAVPVDEVDRPAFAGCAPLTRAAGCEPPAWAGLAGADGADGKALATPTAATAATATTPAPTLPPTV